MISRLRGTLLIEWGDRVEVRTAGGVVYRVEVPLTILERLPPSGEEVELLTLQVVREDSITLYGFLGDREREIFALLLTATGVGAKLATSMLSTYSADRLARALAERDAPALTRISGIGKKTAERIVVELSDRVRKMGVAPAAAAEPGDPPTREAVAALVALGYSPHAAREAVGRAVEEGGPKTAEELIRLVLAAR